MKLPTIALNSDNLSFNDSLEKEWLISNGLGGYSSSTVLGLNTRKYHGLLVAALNPPGNRTVCLASLDESLITNDTIYNFGSHEFHDSIFPLGHLFLREFSLSPFPTFTYQANNFTLKKTVFMPNKSNTVITLYSALNSSEDANLRIFPLLTCRHIDTVMDHLKTPLNFYQESDDKQVKLCFQTPKAIVSTYTTSGKFVEKPDWINAIHYREESLRGELDTDDCYQPGYFDFSINSGKKTKFAIAATATPIDNNNTSDRLNFFDTNDSLVPNIDSFFEQQIIARKNIVDSFYSSHEKIPPNGWLNWIILASDSFIVQDFIARKSVIAGYFWFESWGRDTFISLPGLMLVTGRFGDAKFVLLNFIRYCRNGLIPNIILDRSGQPLYNTVDGTLWYVNAVFQYLKYTGDFRFIKEQLWETLKSIVENHEVGTEFKIRLDSDGLLSHGERLTWMDAYADQKSVTPREGKAVEIQALWYNTLRIMNLLANLFKEHNLEKKYSIMAEKTKRSFEEKFWNASKNCLFDVLDESGPDLTLRPNQIIAVSLDFTMLNQDRNRKIVDFVQGEFLTPCGLRTLSRSDPRYKGVYSGIMKVRDQAYHNGAVWPWLLGPFITGYLKAWGNAALNMEFVMKNFVQALFEKQIYTSGLGTISEIFDGDPPYKPRGCISQAWSVAEPLRAYLEDVLQIRPKYERRFVH
jgi:predicted glycogen debranching enzyme